MPLLLNHSQADFAAQFVKLVNATRGDAPNVAAVVAGILADVHARGDAALLEYTNQFDGHRPAALSIPLRMAEQAYNSLSKDVQDALKLAASRIKAFHATQQPASVAMTDDLGVEMGLRWSAIDAAGLYVPGGKAAYPSSVLMNALPAKVAGVKRVSMVVPTPQGEVNPIVLAAAHIAGVDTIHPIGGAQAVGALAYGTQSIQAVDKIVGPGNAYVAEAKRQVFGRVGIDSIAGPSEILVVADGAQNPEWLAWDLLSQAEHDALAQAILITDSAALARDVQAHIDRLLPTLPRRAIAEASWRDYGVIMLVDALQADAPALINALAPEHLELCVAQPDALLPLIRHAGSIFIGAHTPEAIGDYLGGPNHVLPTDRTARFASGLSVYDFMKRTTTLYVSPAALPSLGNAAITLATLEGLTAHAGSVACRVKGGSDA